MIRTLVATISMLVASPVLATDYVGIWSINPEWCANSKGDTPVKFGTKSVAGGGLDCKIVRKIKRSFSTELRMKCTTDGSNYFWTIWVARDRDRLVTRDIRTNAYTFYRLCPKAATSKR